MSRWSAIAFFTGVALLSAALLQFQRWPALQVQTYHSDFDELEPFLRGAWELDLDELVGTAWFESSPRQRNVLSVELGVLFAIAALGAAVWRWRKRAGAFLLMGTTFAGSVLLALTLREVQAWDRVGHGCGPYAYPLWSPELLPVATLYIFATGALLAVVWVAAQRGKVTFRPAVGAAVIALAMLGVSVAGEHSFAEPHDDPGWQPLRLLALTALLLAGSALAFRRALLVSHAASLAMLLTGVLAMVPAIAIARDFTVEVHSSYGIYRYHSDKLLPTVTCEQPEFAPVISLTPEEVVLSGATLSDINDPMLIELTVRHRITELTAQLAEIRSGPLSAMTLLVDPSAPLPIITAVARGVRDAGVHRLQFVSTRELPDTLWSRPTVHLHACAVFVELSDDGVPITRFAGWPALLAAADSASSPLRLRP